MSGGLIMRNLNTINDKVGIRSKNATTWNKICILRGFGHFWFIPFYLLTLYCRRCHHLCFCSYYFVIWGFRRVLYNFTAVPVIVIKDKESNGYPWQGFIFFCPVSNISTTFFNTFLLSLLFYSLDMLTYSSLAHWMNV